MRRKRNAPVVWNGGTEEFICRDERCTIVEVHLAHPIIDTYDVVEARRFVWGWGFDPFEAQVKAKQPRPERGRDRRRGPPYQAVVLDEYILSAITSYTVKPLRVIYEAILDDYGSCGERRLRRRLEALRAAERVAYISFDSVGMVAGYTTPGSKLLGDPVTIKEILWHQLSDFGERELAA